MLGHLYADHSVSADQHMNTHGLSQSSMANPSTDCHGYSGLPPSKVAKSQQKILLLQGPVGPFFSDLHNALDAAGFGVKRVLFNSGDEFFALGQNNVRFTGILGDWEAWLRLKITQYKPDFIVLFGSNRPAHTVARRVAKLAGIPVMCLEEGYLRSGYVTAELGGNNQHSPLIKWKPQGSLRPVEDTVSAVKAARSSFLVMSVWGALYYLAREAFSRASDEELFHRPRERVLPMAWSWCNHMVRQMVARIAEFPILNALRKKSGYILIPLQVSQDSQVQIASRQWNLVKLVDASLRALAHTELNQLIVFKLHPLERENGAIARLIKQKAKALGVRRARFAVLRTGRIGELSANSGGVIVINSTSAFSALHHKVPLLVMGDAVYRHAELVTIGNDDQDIANFLKLRSTKSEEAIQEFVEAVKAQSLLPGDFYVAAGRKIAAQNIVHKLKQLLLDASVIKEAKA
jgi:capsular polysaccharide export protein